MEIGKFALLNQFDGKLAQRVDGKDGDILIGGTAGRGEVLADVLPNAWPLQTDTTNVVVGDFDNFLQAEGSRLGQGKLFQGHLQKQIGSKEFFINGA